ncbi:MAG TPA: putative sulfate exporter family transporter, partial [Planctomycetaceae bacterium]|nr:putative sulfate exporter family transporter [Planctomycetaceae bacterium]
PLAAFRDGSGRFAVAPVALGMGWVVAVGTLGAALGGGSVRRFLPGGALLAALTCLAYLLAAQKVVKFYNLEYPLWALAVGLLVGN